MPLPSYEQLLAPLDKTAGLVRRPLSASEIQSLEKKLGLEAPPAVRAWLTAVGFFQDLTHFDDSDFNLFETPDEVIENRRFILHVLGQSGADLFPFGDDGAGNVIAVRRGSDGEDNLIFLDHETRQATVIATFSQWLNLVMNHALERASKQSVPKLWCVQFSFKASDEKPIFKALAILADVKIPNHRWIQNAISPAGVKSAKLQFLFNGQMLTMSRMEYPAWSNPMFSFDYHEPVSMPLDQSQIRKIDELFRARVELGYKFVDYGPLKIGEA